MAQFKFKAIAWRVVFRFLWYALIASAVVLFLKPNLIIHPQISLMVQTDRPELIQVFCDQGKGFSEKLSSSATTSISQQKGEPIKLLLHGGCNNLRLDLGGQDSIITISAATLVSSNGSQFDILDQVLSPSYFNEVKISESNRGKFLATANDPWVLLNGDFSELTEIYYSWLGILKMLFLYVIVFGAIAILGCLINMVGFLKLIQLSRLALIRLANKLDNLILTIYVNKLKKFDFKLSEFGVYLFIAFVFHVFEISNFLISIDDEYSAFRTTPEVWIFDGRWTTYLIERFIFPQPTIPFAPNLIFCALMAMSYMILLRAHGISKDWRAFLLFPIYAAFPSLWFINEFYGNMVAVAVGFLMTSISLLVFSQKNQGEVQGRFSLLRPNIVLSATFLAIAVGAYQSFFMLFIAAGFGLYLFQNTNNLENTLKSPEIKKFSSIAVYATSGLLIYAAVNKFFKYFFPSTYSYIGGFINTNQNLYGVFSGFIKEVARMYLGSPAIYGISIGSLGVLIILSSLITIYRCRGRRLWVLSALILMLLSPFLLNLITGPDVLPTRSFVAIPYIVWIMALLFISEGKLIFKATGLLLVLIVVVKMIFALGNYAAATTIGQVHDRTLAASIYQRIANSNPNFNFTDVAMVDIYGFKSIESVYPYVRFSTANRSFFDWDGGNISRMLAYMKLMGYPNLHAVSPNQMKDNIVEFKKMPTWPNADAVKYINGMYLIKLSGSPDPNHIEDN